MADVLPYPVAHGYFQRSGSYFGRSHAREGQTLTSDPDLSAAPDEDSGSETLARYDYQINLTAMACVQMLADSTVLEIICEWWEDYVFVRHTGNELVSVKHVEPSQGAWTLSRLIADGGVGHLFGRWNDAGQKPSCRLQTNGGLTTGSGGAQVLAAATRGVGTPEMAARIARALGTSDSMEVERFITNLTIEHSLPKRDDLLASLLVNSLQPRAALLGWEAADCAVNFEAIRSVVYEAARADLRAESRAIRVGPSQETDAARALARKTVTREKVLAALRRASGGATALARKLDTGGFGPTDVERCKRLRASWLQLEHQWDPDLPGDTPTGPVKDHLQDLAWHAETQTREFGATYGPAMRDVLVQLLREAPAEMDGRPLQTDVALGAAYDLTDRCRIWWSDRFDLVNHHE